MRHKLFWDSRKACWSCGCFNNACQDLDTRLQWIKETKGSREKMFRVMSSGRESIGGWFGVR